MVIVLFVSRGTVVTWRGAWLLWGGLLAAEFETLDKLGFVYGQPIPEIGHVLVLG